MARMISGASLQDFSPISKINYDTMARDARAGLNVRLAGSMDKNARLRNKIKEGEQNRLLNQTNEANIGAILSNNENLLQVIESGEAPESVQNAYTKYEKGRGSVESNSLLSQFLTLSDTQEKQNQALKFEKEQTEMMRDTQKLNALANYQKAVNANRPDKGSFTQSQLEEYNKKGFAVTNLKPAGEDQKGQALFTGDFNAGKPMSVEQVIEARKNGLDVKGEYLSDGSLIATGFNTVGKNVAPMDEAQKEAFKKIGQQAGVWTSAETGGAIKAQANLETYLDIVNDLESGALETGTPSDKLINFLQFGGLDDNLRGLFDPEKQNAIELVRGVVFQGLRETLGAQFTEREGTRLVQTSYNSALSAEDNIKRLKRLASVLKATMDYKTELSNRVLAGGFGESFIRGDYLNAMDFYEGAVAEMEYEFKQEDDLKGKLNPNGYPANMGDTSLTRGGVTITFED